MEFLLLGPLAVRDGGRDVPISGAKRRTLLALLLLNANRVVPADRLIEELWEGEPPASAASTLQSHIYNLRRALGPDRLRTRGTGYLLEVQDGECDSRAFDADLAQGRAALDAGDTAGATVALTHALARWRGPAYDDVGGATWATAEVARLEEARAVAFESLLDARLAAGADAEAVGRAESAVAEFPLRERLWGQLMLALYRTGRQAEALRTYQRVRTLLGEELGIEPGAELRALEQAILAQDPALARPAVEAAAVSAVSLPSGVVTFLLTDIVGSTAMWDRHPAEMEQALARHDAIIRGIVETYGGVLIKARGEGDSTFSVFGRASDAAAAARAAQRGLAAEVWPVPAPIEARMALHTGEALERDGDYFGPAVNRVARLRAIATGGQILVSRSTTEVVVDHLPADCQLVELGSYELQDLARPETVYLLSTPTGQTSAAAAPPTGTVPLPVALAGAPFAGFHGRATERELFAQRLKDVRGGSHRVVFVAGEPGIGKTSLAGEVARAAAAEGAIVLYGRCDEEVGVPYRPWVEAVGHLATYVDSAVLDQLGSRRLAHLARLASEVGERMPGLVEPVGGDPEAERYLLFGSVVSLLQAAAANTPIILVLDDLHWADKPTISLLRHVVAVAEPLSVLIVGTYRHSDLSADHPFTDALAALRRVANVERVTLGGLGDDELVALVETASGQEIAGAELGLLQAIHRETDGNPFYAWEMILHLSESGAVALSETGRWLVTSPLDETSLPDSVREVIGRRVARLGAEVKPVLATAAVIGRDFDLDTLTAALGTEPEAVLDALERAEAAQLVTSVARDRFTFNHALIPHTLYQDLNPARRARLHARVAEAIERLDTADARVPELARHWSEATGPVEASRAIDSSRRAGELALQALAPDEALRWYEQALGLLVQQASSDLSLRCELLLGLGDAQRQVGDPAYRKTLFDAAELAQQLGDTERLVRAALTNNRGGALGGIVDDQRIEVQRAALAAIGTEDSADRALLLARLANELYFRAPYEERQALSDEAVAIAERLADPATLLDVTVLWCFANNVPGTSDKRLAVAAEAVALGDSLGDPVATWFALHTAIITAFEVADPDLAGRYIEWQARLTDEIGQPTLRCMAGAHPVGACLYRGDLVAAERAVVEHFELGQATGQPDAITLYGAELLWVRWHQGRMAELVDLMADTLRMTPDLPALKAAVALVMVEAGRADEVEIDVADFDLPNDAALPVGLTVWAEVASALRAVEPARTLFERLLTLPISNAHAASFGTGAVAHHRALMAVVLGRHDEADAYFAEAERVQERLGSPFFLSRTHLSWGRMLLERRAPGDVQRGIALVESARDRAQRFGCAGVEHAAAELLASSLARPDPAPMPSRLGALVPDVFVGRERELGELGAALLAATAGDRRVVLLAGEPGIGKTTLAAHLARDAHAAGATVLYGRCDEGIGLPYQPWIEALGHLVAHAGDTVLDAVGDRHLAGLGRIVLEVGPRRPDFAPAERGEAETDRYLFFRAAAGVLEAAAADAPVVAILDDLHWADTGTLALLRHVVGAVDRSRLLIVATYRHSELSPQHPLRDALTTLRREPGVERLAVRGLDERDLLGYMEASAGHELGHAGAALAQTVHQETDGNPFFAREIFRHLAETRAFVPSEGGRWTAERDLDEADLPESVRDVVAQRVGRLGDDAREALGVAAVIGREFDLDLLQTALGIGEDDLIAVCERAEGAGLVAGVGRGRMGFVHALVQHSLLADLGSLRLARIHRLVAEAIESRGDGTDRAAELAHHWAAVPDTGRAVEYARRAGDQARAALAPHEATRWYSQALELLGTTDDSARCDLLVRLGRAQRDADDRAFDGTLLDAARLAVRVGDDRNLVRAALATATGYSTEETANAERVALIEAAAAVDGIGDAVRARLLGTLAVELIFFADQDRRDAVSRDAVALARRAGDQVTLAQVLLNRFIANWDPELLDERTAAAQEAVEIADSTGVAAIRFWARLFRTAAYLEAGDIAGATGLSDVMTELANEGGHARQRRNDLMFRTCVVLLKGDVVTAERCVTELRALTGPETEVAQLGSGEWTLAWYRGELEPAYYLRSRGGNSEGDCLAAFEAGRFDEARDLLERQHAVGFENRFGTLASFFLCAEVAAGLGDLAICRTIYDHLLPFADCFVFDGARFVGTVRHPLGLLGDALGMAAEAEAHFAVADARNRRLGAPFLTSRTLLAWGRARVGWGEAERATRLLEEAAAIAGEFGCAGVERDARAALALLR